ncbi:HD domain-containing protein [Actinomadura parmotrematis]|uniref:HD domain-containing protein n=1 Tax=Actinomadura parmotrematis TaxID=2864039 RepID=A0ABS7G237_9ACTN|nr:HD domain-containing protein [Actinomadura parmotrematis]MBW8486768.1 HD domain-containing protein [Actinomadura parmotrematis]
MEIPTDDEIRALHEKHAPTPEAFERVHTHCRIVCAIAEQLLDRLPRPVDRALVRAGCLLHDIGVYRLYDAAGRLDGTNYIRHGVLGEELLRKEGLPEVFCRFCSHHTGTGLTRDDVVRQHLPLPIADYLAETDEERLVMYADKFHSKSTPPVFKTPATFARQVLRYGEEKVEAFDVLRAEFGDPDLAPLSADFGDAIT